MFSKKDYIDYFEEIGSIEQHMMKDIVDLEKETTDEKTLELFEIIRTDEVKHKKIVDEILQIIR